MSAINERCPHLRRFEATIEGFQCAFSLKVRHISECVFIDQRFFPHITYNPLEFAIKTDDVVSARKLFNFNVGFQSPLCNETILHFYIDCVGDKKPNPEMLSLVLERCNIPWVWKSKDFSHPVEKALQKVIGIKKLNEPLLKALLPFGVRFTKNGLSIPFLALKNSYIRTQGSDDPFRSERLFLRQISTYTALEKSFHPHSKAGLTSSEFRDLTPFFRKEIMKRATSEAFSVNCYFQKDNFLQFDLSKTLKEQEASLAKIMKKKVNEKVSKLLNKYYEFFKKLVPETEFKSSFSEEELNLLNPLLERIHLRESYPSCPDSALESAMKSKRELLPSSSLFSLKSPSNICLYQKRFKNRFF